VNIVNGTTLGSSEEKSRICLRGGGGEEGGNQV